MASPIYDMRIHGVTQSNITKYRECPMKQGISLAGWGVNMSSSQAIQFGNIYHEAQELTLRSIRDGLLQEDLNAEYYEDLFSVIEEKLGVASLTAVDRENMEMCMGMAEALVPQYFDEWAEIYFGESAFKIIELEKEFALELFFNGSVTYRGKIDGVLTDSNGDYWLLEHKTKGSWDEESLISIIPRELQVNLYALAVEQIYGKMPKGVIYNVSRRPALRYSKTKETYTQFFRRVAEDIADRRDFYFKKYVITLTEEDITRSYEQACATVSRMQNDFGCMPEDVSSLFHHRTVKLPNKKVKTTVSPVEQYTHSCTNAYGACPFVRLCGSRGEDTFGLARREKIFSELDMADLNSQL